MTSRVKTDPHQSLLDEKKGAGFPHLAFLDADGALLAIHDGDRNAAAFDATFARAEKIRTLRAKPPSAALLAAETEEGLLDEEEVEKRKAALGSLDVEAQKLLQVALERHRLRRDSGANLGVETVAHARALLALLPGDDEALRIGAGAARSPAVRDLATSLDWVEEGLRRAPSLDLQVEAMRTYLSVGAGPPAWSALEAARKSAEATGKSADYGPWLDRVREALAARGQDAYEAAGEFEEGGSAVSLWRATGKDPKPGLPREILTAMVRKGGRLVGCVTARALPSGERTIVCEGPAAPELFRSDAWTRNAEGQPVCEGPGYSDVVRMGLQDPTLDEFKEIARTAARSLPHLVESRRLQLYDAYPRVLDATAAGLKVDPSNATLLRTMETLARYGWQVAEAGPSRTVGPLQFSYYRPAGMLAPSKEEGWLAGPVVLVTEGGVFLRSYCLWVTSARPDARTFLYSVAGGIYTQIRAAAPTPPPPEDLLEAAVAADPSMQELRKGLEWLADGLASDQPNPALDLAVTIFKEAVRLDPRNVAAAQEYVKACLAVTDRERDPAKTDAFYPRALGAADHLLRINPGDPEGAAALAVYYYRFGAFPLAAQWASGAPSHPRAKEIQATLQETGHGAYQLAGNLDLDGFKLFLFRRMPLPEQEKSLEGLQLAEICCIGMTGASYRWTACYREQKLGDAVTRDLTFSRFENPEVVRVFSQKPTDDEIKAEIAKVLESLKKKD